jgi:hypothetical protein
MCKLSFVELTVCVLNLLLVDVHCNCLEIFRNNIKLVTTPNFVLHLCVCVCVCVYTYIYIYTHTHTHIYIYIYKMSKDQWSLYVQQV